MAWSIDLDPRAKHELKQLDPQVARRINRFLFERVAPLDDPRSIGQALKGTKLAISGSTVSATTASSPVLKINWSAYWSFALATVAKSIANLKPFPVD